MSRTGHAQTGLSSIALDEKRKALCVIHEDLIQIEQECELQDSVAATASMLQLAVM
eukprot:SAG22_NODE_361_length_11712_cov_6.108155_3_plen_56_part_00